MADEENEYIIETNYNRVFVFKLMDESVAEGRKTLTLTFDLKLKNGQLKKVVGFQRYKKFTNHLNEFVGNKRNINATVFFHNFIFAVHKSIIEKEKLDENQLQLLQKSKFMPQHVIDDTQYPYYLVHSLASHYFNENIDWVGGT